MPLRQDPFTQRLNADAKIINNLPTRQPGGQCDPPHLGEIRASVSAPSPVSIVAVNALNRSRIKPRQVHICHVFIVDGALLHGSNGIALTFRPAEA